MSAELNLEAERAVPDNQDMLFAFHEWIKRRGRLGAGAMPERIFFAGWLAARRAAAPVAQDVAAPIDAEGLPPLPKAAAWKHMMDNTEGLKGNRPMIHLSPLKRSPFGRPGIDYSESYPVTSEPLYTADQLRQAQRDAKSLGYALGRGAAVREYVEGRISPEIPDSLQARQSVDTPEFRELIDRYMDEIYSYKHECQITRDVEEWRALIAYIDGRTAGTAPKWISVKERLPVFDFDANQVRQFIHVIATLIDGKVLAMSYRANGWTKEDSKPSWSFTSGGHCNSDLVTHWMPLPAAPSPNSLQDGAK